MARGRVRMRNHRKRLVFSFLISLFLLVGFVRPAFAAGITFVTSSTNAGTNFVATTTAVSVNAGDTVVAIGGGPKWNGLFARSETDNPTPINNPGGSRGTNFLHKADIY